MKRTQKQRTGLRRRIRQHRLSVVLVSGVIVILAVTLSFASISLREKWKSQDAQIIELSEKLEEEKAREEEIDELEERVGSDEYIEEVARETGLVYPNEIIFQAEP